VKRPALGGEGFVLDHYERAAIQQHLATVGDRLLHAFGNRPPYAVFSDSLEVFGTDWTPNFLHEFKTRRGYDLTPYLPALAENIGPTTAAIRHDWGKTLTEITEENYLTPIREWAHAHGTLFRSQTYGEPPVILSSNSLVDLPEGEHGPEWRAFSAARWAASASHLYGRPVTSSETWTWLHSPAFRATPLDMKAEADLHFLQGINQLIGHGWPYSPASAGEPGWSLYAAAAFNEHNPWFPAMPEITRYLQRVSFLMRQGQPANDIAIYLPTDDAWAHFTPGKISVDQSMNALLGPDLIPQILNAGYNFDFIDDRAIEHTTVPYKLLILPSVERIPLSTLRKLESFLRQGGTVVATRRIPSLAPGFLETKSDSAGIGALAKQLFAGSESNARFITDEQTLSTQLSKLLVPDFAVENEAASSIGFVHRKLPSDDIYFVVNTSNQPVETDAHVHTPRSHSEEWDPITGAAHSPHAIPRKLRDAAPETRPLRIESARVQRRYQRCHVASVGHNQRGINRPYA
jgi:alpha-L-rhamnosidase